jgi:hypothetical protein
MNSWKRSVLVFGLVYLVMALGVIGYASNQSAAGSQESDGSGSKTVLLGGKYKYLSPKQRELVEAWYREFDAIMGGKHDPEKSYDGSIPLSARTTFEAVTHALMNTELTDSNGESLGTPLDLIEVVEMVRGAAPRARGDLQFRIYVVLKPGAVDVLEKSQEFNRGHDNTHYHRDYPINYRQQGTPSIQFSIAKSMERADIDVDYRSSSFPKVLIDGHLTAGNSDVRAGKNYETHVGKWEGFSGWWRSLFGLPVVRGYLLETFDTDYTIPPLPKVTSRESVIAAIHDFLTSWLVDQNPAYSLAYFDQSAFDCVLTLHGNAEAKSSNMAPIRILHEMEVTNRMLGKVTDLDKVIAPVFTRYRRLSLTSHTYNTMFSLYPLSPEVAGRYTCPSPDGYKTVELSEEKRRYYRSLFRFISPQGEGHQVSMVWADESGYWKLVAFHAGENAHQEGIPDIRPTASDQVLAPPVHPTGNPELVSRVDSFLSTLFVNRDLDSFIEYFSEHSHDCSNLYLEEGAQPSQDPEGARKQILSSARAIVDSVPRSENLRDMIVGITPWNPELQVVPHPHERAYMLAKVSADLGERLLCQEHVEHPPIHSELTVPEDFYVLAFHLNVDLETPPVLHTLWAQEDGQWKAVSYHVEAP